MLMIIEIAVFLQYWYAVKAYFGIQYSPYYSALDYYVTSLGLLLTSL